MHKVLWRIPELLSEAVSVEEYKLDLVWHGETVALTWQIGRIVQAINLITSINRTRLKIGWLIHVNPKTIKADIFMEFLDLCLPVGRCIWVKEVGIDSQVRPDTTDK